MSRECMLFLIGLLLVLSIGMRESRSCNLDGTSYICRDISKAEDLQHSLPSFVQKVTLIGAKNFTGFFPNGLFQNSSWANLSALSLSKFNNIHSIDKLFLNGLKSLRFLSISDCYKLQFIDPKLLESTPDLEALYFDGDSQLQLSVVENALDGKADKLKYLSLRELQTEVNVASFLGKSFLKALEGKKLLYLDVSYANIAGLFLNDNYQDALYNLKYFNGSHSKLSWYGISKRTNTGDSFPNLEVADFSGCQSLMPNPTLDKVRTFKCSVPQELKYIFIDNVVVSQREVYMQREDHYTECSSCDRLEVIDLSNNRFVHFNLTVTGVQCFTGLLKFDISKNGLEYISPSLLSSFSALKILDMSKNQLHKMQHMDDFINLLRGNLMMEVLYLRENQLSLIPYNFLISNTRLLLLDLRENDITEFSIDFSHILNLKIIYLGKNRLGGLTSNTYQTLELLYTYQANETGSNLSFWNNNLFLQSLDRKSIAERYRYGYDPNASLSLEDKCNAIPQYLTIDVSENPIECKCENDGFLKWAVNTKIRFINGEGLICNYGNMKSLLDRKLHKSVKFDCMLPVYVITVIASGLSFMVSLSVVILVVRKVRLNRRKVENIEILKREIRKCHHNFSYVAFVPYCSHDYDVVENNILPALRTSLKKTLNTDKEVLCTGMENFIPGKLIIDEIHRCIDECLVVVPIITPAFIQSPWSQNECSVAIHKHREVLLLMEEQTDISQASTTVTHLIENYTRATWSNKKGHLEIRPPLDLVCDRIITVAAEVLNKQTQYQRQTPGNLIPLLEANPT